MNVLKIKNEGLTSYYLDQDLSHLTEQTGLVINRDEESEDYDEDKIELHYEDVADLAKKLSLIFGVLTDR